MKEYHDNGMIKSETLFFNHKKQGVMRYFYDNGQLLKIAYFVDDKLNGHYNEHYENGQLAWECFFKEDNVHGLSIEYYENGNIDIVDLKEKADLHKDNLSCMMITACGFYVNYAIQL